MTRTPLAWTALALSALGLSLVACAGSSPSTDKDAHHEGDDTAATEDTEPVIPTSESDCEDGVDEDQDGVTDCEDPDCAQVFRCTWPDRIQHATNAFFDGGELDCGWFEVDIDDCNTDLTVPLMAFTEGNTCPDCDRSYIGPVTVVRDSCSELLGDAAEPPPRELAFGFRFVSPSERVLWARDPQGVWTEAVTMTQGQDGAWVFSATDEVRDTINQCSSAEQLLGHLTVTLSFTDQ